MPPAVPTSYWLAPPVLVDEDGELTWIRPTGATATVDLRGEAQSGPTGDGLMFAAAPTGVGLDRGVLLGDNLAETITPSRRRAAADALGLGSLPVASVIDTLVEILTSRAQVEGESFVAPLMPTREGEIEIHLAGHSRVWSERVVGRGSKRLKKIIRRKKRELGRIEREHGEEVAAKVATLNARRLRVDFADVLPARLRNMKPRKPRTSFSDDFNRADGALGSPWTGVSSPGNITVSSNQALAGGHGSARYDADVSSDDHTVTLDSVFHPVGGSHAAAAARFAAAADTYYWGRYRASGASTLRKRVAGSNTEIGSEGTSRSTVYTGAVDCNGSTIRFLYDGGEVISVTDTAISGNLRGGMDLRFVNTIADNFLIDDGVSAGATAPIDILSMTMTGSAL